MSVVMWQVIEKFIENYSYELEIWGGYLKRKQKYYSKDFSDTDAPLDFYIGFIDCTKIHMSWPSGQNTYQRAVY